MMRKITAKSELVAGSLVVLAFAVTAIFAPVLAPSQDGQPYIVPTEGHELLPQPPSSDHRLGKMHNQTDVLYGIIWGARVAFKVGLLVIAGRAVIGLAIGLLAGYYRGWIDAVLMRTTDSFLAFPMVAAVLLVSSFFGRGWLGGISGGINRTVVLVLVVFGWMRYARLIRGNVLSEREKDYVTAAESIGTSDVRIMLRHVLPNSYRGLIVLISSDMGAAVVLTAVFSFLGMSGNIPLADWGQMLNLARPWIIVSPSSGFQYWYTYIPPCLAIVLFTIGWNLIGDSLRETLTPHAGGR